MSSYYIMPSKLVFLSVIATVAALAGQSGITLYGPSIWPDNGSIAVTLGSPRPPFSAVQNPSVWRVIVKPRGASVGVVVPLSSVTITNPRLPYATTGQVRLIFATALPEEPESVDVTLTIDQPVTVTWKPKKASPPQPGSFGDPVGFFPSDSKAKADVYLFGSVASGVGSKPSYNLDALLATPSLLLGKKPAKDQLDVRNFMLSAVGTAATADQPNLDPDSFSAAVKVAMRRPWSLDSVGRSYFLVQWDAAKWEFSRKDQAFNFVSAPAAIYNIGGGLKDSNNAIKASVSLDLYGGFELGENLRNKIDRTGYGAIVRAVPGATGYVIFPGALGAKQISFTADYHDRILLEPEPFIDTRGGTKRVSFSRGSRHTLTDILAIKLTDYISIQAKHEYGSLPPAFKFVDHKVTVGITTMWKWRR